ncbi:lytic transglycosylase F [Pseudodesulfovibrio sp.]|uniref:transporter substrate-binding domain-containing protein n=1 Tax=Pseudodesulfovibrio sp. TaxID=2035812 RepID=UPI00263544B0|nr:lytic transglycosylase F [Pseudodesulfovibrio sp.]MDD3312243.1 lytic transglycosylase F [Pseudodesulfovibrio sp.]
MPRPRHLTFVLLLLLLTLPRPAAADNLARVITPWKGDLPKLYEEHRAIRVLVSYNRTNFFLEKGAMRGMEYDLMNAYKEYLGKTSNGPVRMVFVATPFDELLPALLRGEGDIAAAGLTVTPERSRQVAFSAPYRTGVDEIVVGSPRSRPVNELADLSGRTVYVMRGASYADHLREVNAKLKRSGKKPVKILEADPHLVTEDLLEMANAGMIEYAAADSHLASIWGRALPDLRPYADAPLHAGGSLAWAVRPGAKALRRSLDDFVATARQGTLLGNMVYKRYFVNETWVKNPHDPTARQALANMADVFIKYADLYDFDWLKLAAVGFQESRLDMRCKSSAGALGVMQVRPATAADPNVDVPDITSLDGNIHAGTKYLRFLRDNYFQDVEEDAKVDFALAAYNAGPARVQQLRKTARSMGLDPNRWFANVEWAAYRDIGRETPTYVANVQMYYAAYKSISETLGKRSPKP